ncbi:MAG: hypothetical protein DRP45_03610 [Candidatus Zixiibacteriota bacterium]|nr:MAG: hypothetical protein DRP45_03610 [candidate division Zixibacteria bacterium]
MTGLKLWTKKTKPPVAEEPVQGNAAPTVKIETLSPRRRLNVGRQLAFAVDDNAIQMAAATGNGFNNRLLDVRKTYIPSSLEDPDERRSFAANAINSFVERFGGRLTEISLILDGPDTALRTFSLPDMKPADLHSAVKYEAIRQLPFPSDDCLFDYRPVQRITTDSKRHLKIAVIASTKRLVQEQLALFDELGLEVAHLYHCQYVSGQILRFLRDFSHDTNYAMINIQRERCEIAYYHGYRLEFSHIGSTGSSFLANRSDPTMFEYFAEALATEIQNSLDYYSGQQSSQFSNNILVHGDLAYSEELIDRLSDRFGFAFQRFPVEHPSLIEGNEHQFHDTIPVCLSVTAAVTSSVVLPDLLPSERKERHRIHSVNRLGVASLVVLAGILGTFWLSETSSTHSVRSYQTNLLREVEAFKTTSTFVEYNRIKQKIASNQAYIDKTKEVPSCLSLNLKELSHMTPSAIRLRSMDFHAGSENENLHISGVVTTKSSPPEVVLAEFVENLVASPFWENVKVDRYIKKRTKDGFSMEFDLSMKGIT